MGLHRLGLVVEDVNGTVTALQDIDVAGKGCFTQHGNGKAELLLHVHNAFWREIDWHFYRDRYRVRGDYDAPEQVRKAA
jgi:hypothetical protein